MKIKENIKTSVTVLTSMMMGGLLFGAISYANQGLIGSAFECLDGNCNQLVLKIDAIKDKTITMEKLTDTLSGTINGKLDGNNITASEKTKIKYDSNGLVLSGTGLSKTDIPKIDTTQINAGLLTGFNANTVTISNNSKTIATTEYVDRQAKLAYDNALQASSNNKRVLYSRTVTGTCNCSGTNNVCTPGDCNKPYKGSLIELISVQTTNGTCKSTCHWEANKGIVCIMSATGVPGQKVCAYVEE